MSRQKLQRFEHNTQAENVIERGKPLYTTIRGRWKEVFFKNEHPVVLELACGKGEYTVGMGRQCPDRNFIGVDIKGERIARGSKQAIQAGLTNVAFLRTGIQYLGEFFEENEVDEIWLIHPDPQPRDKEEKKRLTNPAFLSLYHRYLKDGGVFNVKTDNPFLYEYTLDMLQRSSLYTVLDYTDDLYHSPLHAEHMGITTHYERLFMERGFTINYIKSVCKK